MKKENNIGKNKRDDWLPTWKDVLVVLLVFLLLLSLCWIAYFKFGWFH